MKYLIGILIILFGLIGLFLPLLQGIVLLVFGGRMIYDDYKKESKGDNNEFKKS